MHSTFYMNNGFILYIMDAEYLLKMTLLITHKKVLLMIVIIRLQFYAVEWWAHFWYPFCCFVANFVVQPTFYLDIWCVPISNYKFIDQYEIEGLKPESW